MFDVLLYVCRQTLLLLLNVLQVAMLVRAVLSWIDQEGESRLSAFLYMVTEPIILPVRALFHQFNWFAGMPLDMPFFFTVLLLSVLQTVISIL